MITIVSLLPEDNVFITISGCDPAQAGVSVQTLSNQFGCDSVVIMTTALLPSDTVPIAASSCDPAQVGVSVQMLSNQFGCDSIVITTTSFDSTICIQQTILTPRHPGCADAADGMLLIEVLTGQPPFDFQWVNDFGNSGTGVIDNLNTEVEIDGLPAGNYSITITSQINNTTEVLNATLSAPAPLLLNVQTTRPACTAGPAVLNWMANGGVLPYTLSIDGQVASGGNIQLPEGYHLISLEDAEGCSTDTLLLVEGALLPVITLPPDTSIVIGTVLRIDASTNLTEWSEISWQPLSDSTCSTCLFQEWAPLQSGLVSVTIWDTAGCPASSSMRIYVTSAASSQ